MSLRHFFEVVTVSANELHHCAAKFHCVFEKLLLGFNRVILIFINIDVVICSFSFREIWHKLIDHSLLTSSVAKFSTFLELLLKVFKLALEASLIQRIEPVWRQEVLKLHRIKLLKLTILAWWYNRVTRLCNVVWL